MLMSILLPFAIYYIFKRAKVKNKRPEDFPGVDAVRFEEWRKLELLSIDWFLWPFWIIFAFLFFAQLSVRWTELLAMTIFAIIILVACLIVASIFQIKASRIKKELGIK